MFSVFLHWVKLKKSIDKEFHYEDFSYIDYKFGRVNGVFPKATISLPVVTATISDGMFDHKGIRLVTKEGLAILKSKGLLSTDKLIDMRVGSFAYDYVMVPQTIAHGSPFKYLQECGYFKPFRNSEHYFSYIKMCCLSSGQYHLIYNGLLLRS